MLLSKPLAIAIPGPLLAPLLAVLLGIGLLYLGGFAHVEALHHGAHDARHSAAIPCH